MESNKIILGGKEYTIRHLTLREARALGVSAAHIGQSKEGAFGASLDHSVNVVATCLKRDYPQVSAEGLLDSELGVWELHAAADAILTYSGFVRREGATGEAAPGAGPA